jgi:hypothetical protein
VYDKFPTLNSIPRELKMNFDVILDKPYYVKDVPWTTNDAIFTQIGVLNIPDDILVNQMLQVPFNTAAKYRTKMKLLIQVAGTPQHQGTVIVAAMPGSSITPSRDSFNSMLQAPHVFLSANESTPVALEVPFYSQTKLRNTQYLTTVVAPVDRPWYSSVYFMVVNPLAPPTGGTTTVSIVVHARFIESEFYVPCNNYSSFFLAQASVVSGVFDSIASSAKTITGDFIDNVRKYVKNETGLHNPNHPFINSRMIVANRNFNNTVDVPTYVEKLDPYANHDRVCDEPVFYSDRDEMLLSSILQKPQFINTITFTTANTTGAVLFSRPITPLQEKMSQTNTNMSTPLQVFGYMSRFWRGKLKLHIQSCMTNFHYCKLLIARDYSCNASALAGAPLMEDFTNLQTETVEFSGGGQVQTIELPYCSVFEETPIMPVAAGNAMSHGIYYIYLAQPLVYNGSVPTQVYFNIYISAGDDFNFYGYSLNELVPVTQATFEAQAAVPVNPSEQSQLLVQDYSIASPHKGKFQPIVSVRDHLRRYIGCPNVGYDATQGGYQLRVMKVTDLLKITGGQVPSYQGFSRIARRYFYGFSGGLKFKFVVTGVSDAMVKYFPPSPQEDPIQVTAGAYVWGASSIASTNSTVQNVQYAQDRYPKATNGAQDYATAPTIETSTQYLRDFSLAQTLPAEGELNLGKVILECTVPYMSALEFVGDGNITRSSATPLNRYTNDLGTIVIAWSVLNALGAAVDTPNVQITPYVAYADEARLGFQVFAPSFQPSTSTTLWTNPYQQADGSAYNYEYITSALGAYLG